MQDTLKDFVFLNTRPAGQQAELTELLESRGGTVITFPTIEIRYCCNLQSIKQALTALGDGGWLLFSSANAIRSIASAIKTLPLWSEGFFADSLKRCRIAVIGQRTALLLGELDLQADFVAQTANSAAFAEELISHIKSQSTVHHTRVLFCCGNLAGDELPSKLRQAGVDLACLTVYRSELPVYNGQEILGLLSALGCRHGDARPASPALSMLLVSSSQAARNLFILVSQQNSVREEDWRHAIQQIPIAVIGERTAQTAQELGFRHIVVAEQATVFGLARAAETHFARR